MSAFVYDGFTLEEFEKMLGLFAVSYADLQAEWESVCVRFRETQREEREKEWERDMNTNTYT